MRKMFVFICKKNPGSLYVKKSRIFKCFSIFQCLTRINVSIRFHVQHFCWFVISNLLLFVNFVGLVYLKAPNNKIYEITTTLIDFGYSLTFCTLFMYGNIYIIRCD